MTRQFYGANVDFMKTIKFLEKQPSTLLNRFPAVLPGKYKGHLLVDAGISGYFGTWKERNSPKSIDITGGI